MSFSQALDAQVSLVAWYARGLGMRQLRAFYDAALEEGRTATTAGAPAFEDYLRTVLAGLDEGVPIYWSPEMCGLLESVSDAMPAWTLRPEAVPDHKGFVWFAKPLTMPVWPSDGRRDLRAVGFCHKEGSLTITFWMQGPEDERPWPAAACDWDYGAVWQTLADRPRELGVQVENLARQDRIGRYFAAALALMEQRIIVSRAERPSRAARKRAADVWTHEPTIRVVTLRRSAHEAGQSARSGDPVEWSCQWVVRGHWRQQACGPERSERRPVFVLPYVKGDPDKPLKAPADRVFAVIR